MPDAPTISNSTCLIGLEAAEHLDILRKLYGAVDVPDAVAKECGLTLPAWIHVRSVRDLPLVRTLTLDLGTGEAEAIALSIERGAERLILDDKKARRAARQLHQPVTGTLAVLLRAKDLGIIPSVREAIDALIAANFRVSEALVREVLRLANE